MYKQKLFYFMRPLIPRPLQITIRRQIVYRKRQKFGHIWPIDPNSGEPPEGWQGWPDQKRFALILSHDVESLKGQERCMDLAKIEEKMGFRSSFNFVPERYQNFPDLRRYLVENGFEVAVHGLKHDGKLFWSRKIFNERVKHINAYLKEWNAVGFHSPSMHRNLDWIHDLNIEYDQSTFDTDPFEPQPKGVGTIFPFWIKNHKRSRGYIELPYTLPQDHALFSIMQEKDIAIWTKKLDWIVNKGGMVLVNTHPDYMNFNEKRQCSEEYPVQFYIDFLETIMRKYKGQYWHVLPKELVQFWKTRVIKRPLTQEGGAMKDVNQPRMLSMKKVWIDLDNSPHVPFFYPIIKELEKAGSESIITARDCFQVCGLADRIGLKYEPVGRHYGKMTLLKIFGTLLRSAQLIWFLRKKKPSLFVSHGSRSGMIAATILGIPIVTIIDYEFAEHLPFIRPVKILVPEVVSSDNYGPNRDRVMKYPGIKEDVYVPDFKPDPRLLRELGINKDELIVTIRPPATEAHYHNPESEKLFETAVSYLGKFPGVRMVILPRNEKKQTEWIRENWFEWNKSGKIIIPAYVIDGLNLIWYSDFVISGGGTMNREAAALGVPVYSIFRGRIGAVDRYLVENGRLILIEKIEDVESKIRIVRREKNKNTNFKSGKALKDIMAVINELIYKSEN